MPAEFRLVNYAYCGMPIPIKQGDKEDVRTAAAHYLRRLRREGFPVVVIERGEEWEVQEPEDSVLVPDECGLLTLCAIPVRLVRCWDCGEDVPEGETCSCRICCDCGNDYEWCSCCQPEE